MISEADGDRFSVVGAKVSGIKDVNVSINQLPIRFEPFSKNRGWTGTRCQRCALNSNNGFHFRIRIVIIILVFPITASNNDIWMKRPSIQTQYLGVRRKIASDRISELVKSFKKFEDLREAVLS